MIENIAVKYGDAHNGRSCKTCRYVYSSITSHMCGMHEMATRPDKVCGTWCDVKKAPKDEKHEELF